MKTADLCDRHGHAVRIAAPLFRDFGAHRRFHGDIVTLRVYEDNVLVREALMREGDGRILVVDGGGSLNCALLGGNLASMACEHGWRALLINGCVRDSAELATLPLGIRALHTSPRRSAKQGRGESDVTVSFAGIAFVPGAWLCADEDGLIVADRPLTLTPDTPA